MIVIIFSEMMIFVYVPSKEISQEMIPTSKAIKWELYLILLMMNQYNFLIIIMVRYGILMKIWMKLYVIKIHH